MKRKIPTLSILFCAVSLSSCWTDNCPNRDFVVANITESNLVACIDWSDFDDDEMIRKIVMIEPNSVNKEDVDACSIEYVFACPNEYSDTDWSKMDEETRKEWCKKVKCVDCKSKSCWGDYGPMKYNGTACVCDY